MATEEKKMKSIWYLVGIMLLAIGIIVTSSGLYYLFNPMPTKTVLGDLRADLWWGGIMLVAGLIFMLTHRGKTH